MNRIIPLMLLLSLIAFSFQASAAQYCLNEGEIPSSTPTNRFTDHGNGTVTDEQTGLMWAKCVEGTSGVNCAIGDATIHNWAAALALAVESELAGYTDWRLPNIKNLGSIVEVQCVPAINLAVFPNSFSTNSSYRVWSSSPDVQNPAHSYYLWFFNGSTFKDNRTEEQLVRLVRPSQ